MEALTILAIGVGLAMDTFAISIAAGGVYRQMHIAHALRMAGFFGGFQAIMPLAGYAAGAALRGVIASYDHWVAAGLLAVVGGKMIYEAAKIKQAEAESAVGDPTSLAVVLVLSLATSIDALAVGVTLSLITRHVFAAAAAIGAITFAISCAGCWLGKRAGHLFENKIEIAGGLILLGIGVKIVVQHLVKGT